MAKVRDLLLHVSIETAERRRKCHRKPAEHAILHGAVCLVVKGGPRNAPKNYCVECAGTMIAAAEQKLAKISAELGRLSGAGASDSAARTTARQG
jgi:hypothetical protein